MARIPDHQPNVIFASEGYARGHIIDICGIDSINGLITQSAILRRLLAGSDIEDRTRLSRIREPDRRAGLEGFACPSRVNILA